MARFAILGVGVMGETLLAGLLSSGTAADDVVCAVRRPERAAELRARHGVRVLPAAEAARAADVVFVAAKPQDTLALLDEIAESVRPGTVVASVAAGLPTSLLEAHLPAGTAVVRAMPNTPARVDEAMSAVSPGSHAGDADVQAVVDALAGVGRVVVVAERHQDAVTAISGTGPAYLFYAVEAMIDAGVLLGLPRATATELVVQTMLGSAKLLRESGEHPTVLRENVTSPGGTTAAAIRQFEANGVRAAFVNAIEAARDRSAELAELARRADAGPA